MAEPSEDVFPWEAGVFDAHCHPTDIMKDIPMIQEMKARALTIMSTRSEDQHLVELTAQVYGIRSRDDVEKANPGTNQKVVPAFGWHPWFTCQLYDDTAADATYDPNGDPEKEKLRHYAAVLRNVAPGKASVTENPTFVSGLPDPRPLSAFLDETRRRLLRYPYALVGEIGLDGMARLPEAWTEDQKDARDGNITRGTREGRPLTSYVTTKDHQVRVFQAQLALAAELERAVSIHLVDSGGAMWETLKSSWKGHELKFKTKKERHAPTKPPQPEPPKPKPYPPRICMHSFSGNPSYFSPFLDRHIPVKFYFSASQVINLQRGGRREAWFRECVKMCPDSRVLVESDHNCAGEKMDDALAEVAREICKIKGWRLDWGVKQLAQNYKDFIFGAEEKQTESLLARNFRPTG